jgi:hypothetical protein
MTRYLHVVFCDDVRQEVGNKMSLIGVYGADLFVNELPIVLPKLAIFITVATEESNPFASLSLAIYRGDERISEIVIGDQDLANTRQQAHDLPDAENATTLGPPRLITHNAVVAIAPFPIEKPQILRIIATTESGEILGPALRIGLAPGAGVTRPAGGANPTDAPLH